MQAGVEDAVAFLQKSVSAGAGAPSLFDHLTDVLSQVLSRRPDNALDSFEALSYDVKQQQASTSLPPPPAPATETEELEAAERVLDLARREKEQRDNTGDDVLGELSLYERLSEEDEIWSCGGVGCASKSDVKSLALSMNELQATRQLEFVRLWGKVFGRRNDYIICESAPRDGTSLEDTSPRVMRKRQEEQDMKDQVDEAEQDEETEEQVKAKAEAAAAEAAKAAREVPSDEEGVPGANRYVYWACTRIGGEWRRLPAVTPAQIVAARRIRKFLTGDLDAQVVSWPAFPGKEENYLRAQIARISAAASVSPKGLFSTLEQDNNEDDEAEQPEVVEAEDYAGLPVSSLMDPRNWAHHTVAILKQGRCTFWRAPKETQADGETEGEDNGDETDVPTDSDQPQQDAMEEVAEQGPPILTSVCDDETLSGGIPAWSTRRVCGVPGKGSCVVLASNRWPGSFATAYGSKFANLYVGFGLKCPSAPWAPEVPKEPAREYAPELPLEEAPEPTLEQEKELEEKLKREAEERERLALEAKQAEQERLEREAAAQATANAEGGTAGESDAAGASGAETGGETTATEGLQGGATTEEDEDIDEEEEDIDEEEETESEVPK